MASKLGGLDAKQSFFVGITLFSMFFGAGNLILAPLMGVQAGTSTPLALAGFIVSGVGFPVLCIAAIALAGSALKLIDRIHPLYSKIFMVLIYLSIGPFLAIPRTASTSYSMIEPLLGDLVATDQGQLIGRIAFSLIFFAVAFWLALRPGKLTQVMGKISGPILILLIIAVVGAMIVNPPVGEVGQASAAYAASPALAGFVTGYQTMDVLAAFAFGIVIAMNIRSLGVEDSKSVASQVIKSGVIAGVLLALIYIGFGYLGMKIAVTVPAGTFENGAQVITAAAEYQFGAAGVVVVAAIYLLACLNVCIGLICSISEYFSEQFSQFSYKQYAIATTIVSFLLSIVGLTAILAYSVPILLALYPPALLLVLMGLLLKHADAYRLTWRVSIAVTTLLSTIVAVRDGFMPTLALPLDSLPLADLSLGWLVPAVVVFVIMQILQVSVLKPKVEA